MRRILQRWLVGDLVEQVNLLEKRMMEMELEPARLDELANLLSDMAADIETLRQGLAAAGKPSPPAGHRRVSRNFSEFRIAAESRGSKSA